MALRRGDEIEQDVAVRIEIKRRAARKERRLARRGDQGLGAVGIDRIRPFAR